MGTEARGGLDEEAGGLGGEGLREVEEGGLRDAAGGLTEDAPGGSFACGGRGGGFAPGFARDAGGFTCEDFAEGWDG